MYFTLHTASLVLLGMSQGTAGRLLERDASDGLTNPSDLGTAFEVSDNTRDWRR